MQLLTNNLLLPSISLLLANVGVLIRGEKGRRHARILLFSRILNKFYQSLEVYSETYQTSKMEVFVIIING